MLFILNNLNSNSNRLHYLYFFSFCSIRSSNRYNICIIIVAVQFAWSCPTSVFEIWYHKTPQRERRQNILWQNHSNFFLDLSTKGKKKTKKNKYDLIKLKSFCTTKGNHWQNKNTTYWTGENIYKWYNKGLKCINSSYKSILKA